MEKNKLHIIAPILSEISLKGTGFEIPQNYMSAVEENVISELMLQKKYQKETSSTFKLPENYFDEIEDVVLAKLKTEIVKNKDPYNLPDNYFDTIEDRVLNKMRADKKVFSIKKITAYLAPIAIAASLLLIFILNTNKKTITFDSLATAEIEQFIDNGNVDINSESLALAFSSVEIPTNIMRTLISEEEVIDYLYTEDLEAIIYEN